jgi:integrase
MSKRLKIPKRDRGKYEYIKCGKCKQVIGEICPATKQKIDTCKFLHRHKFHLRYYVPNSGSRYISKNFATKDYKEFKKQAENFIESFEGTEFEEVESQPVLTPEIKENKAIAPTQEAPLADNVEPILNLSFKSLLLRYVDYLYGINVPAHKYTPKDEKTIKDYIRNIKDFKKALKLKGIEVGDMLITEIGDMEVGYYHEYLTKTKKEDGSIRFSPRTYNNRMRDNRAFFNYIKDSLGVNVTNPFDEVKKKFVKRKNFIVELNEFEELLKMVTKKNGEFEQSDRGNIYIRNHYRSWLKDAYKLALYTGERRDGIVLMRWSFVDLKERIITLPNYKVNKIKDMDKDRLIPITIDLYELLRKMGANKLKGTEQYLICPEHKNRETVKDWISKSFTHYWKLLNFNPEVSFRHLRKTYVTLIYSQFGDKTKAVTDQNVDTILEYYLNKKNIVSQAKNLSLYDLEERRKAM